MKRLPRLLAPFALLVGAAMGNLSVTLAEEATQTASMSASPPSAPDARVSAATPPPPTTLTPADSPAAQALGVAQARLAAQLADPQRDTKQLARDFAELARHYAANEMVERAATAYRQAAELAPDEPRFIYALAHLLEQAGLNEEAAAAYRHFLRGHPQYLPGGLRLANLLRRSGKLEEADHQLAAMIAPLVAAQPGLTALFAERGALRRAQRRTPEAAADLELALAAEPKATRLHQDLAGVYRDLGDPARAGTQDQQHSSQGVSLPDPLLTNAAPPAATPEQAILLGGEIAQRYDDADGALASYREALALNPKSIPAHLGIGAALTMKGDSAGARTQFEEAARLAPDAAAPRYYLGVLSEEAGDREAALGHLSAAAGLVGDDLNLRLAIAQTLHRMGSADLALAQFNEAAQRHPNANEGWLGAAAIMLERERYAEVRKILEQAYEANPDEGRIAHDLARLLAASPDSSVRDGAKAFDLARKVFAARNNADHGETLAMALAEAGRCDDAAQLQLDILSSVQGKLPESEIARYTERLAWYREQRPCRPPTAEQESRQAAPTDK